MNKLIKNELTKIFKKKSIYITLLVILAFVILTNCIYKFLPSGGYYENNSEYEKYLNSELERLDPKNPSDTRTLYNNKNAKRSI